MTLTIKATIMDMNKVVKMDVVEKVMVMAMMIQMIITTITTITKLCIVKAMKVDMTKVFLPVIPSMLITRKMNNKNNHSIDANSATSCN